jgi:hypothetical protein
MEVEDKFDVFRKEEMMEEKLGGISLERDTHKRPAMIVRSCQFRRKEGMCKCRVSRAAKHVFIFKSATQSLRPRSSDLRLESDLTRTSSRICCEVISENSERSTKGWSQTAKNRGKNDCLLSCTRSRSNIATARSNITIPRWILRYGDWISP